MMRLKSIKYSEFEGTAQQWTLENLSLSEMNLLVGKNASGKSRLLSLILGLSNHLAGLVGPSLSGNFDAEFAEDGETLRYQLKYDNKQVSLERFSIGNEIVLERGEGGVGSILTEKMGRKLDFQAPTSEIAALARRDSIQHSFLERLFSWGSSVRYYGFGTPLGRETLGVVIEGGKKPNERNPSEVVAIYRQAKKEFGDLFDQSLVKDMRLLGYDLESLAAAPPVSIRWEVMAFPQEPIGLSVKERDLASVTDQIVMSQGMFRALSLLIQVNYSQMARRSDCILIDDIGEGLDFDRSCSLIDVLREKAKTSHFQLIMSTNDRFVMNRVPLEEWSVIQRTGSFVRVLNYENSRKLFEEFRFTGLSNFSFLEMDFASGSPAEEAEPDE